MRLRTSRRLALVVALATVGACSVACNLIAGIDDGVLVSSSDGGAGSDGRRTGEGGTRRDAMVGHDARTGADGHMSALDASKDTSSTHDAPHDAGRDAAAADASSPPLSCTVTTGPRLVDDLGADDGGAGLFTGSIFLAPNQGESGFYLIAQVQGDDAEFFAYQVDLAASTIPRTSQQGFGVSGIALFDVLSTPDEVEVLTSFTAASGPLGARQGLQIAALPPTFNGLRPRSASLGISYSNFHQGRLTQLPPNDAGDLVGYLEVDTPRIQVIDELQFGVGPSADAGTTSSTNTTFLYRASAFHTNVNEPFFESEGHLYAIVGGVDIDGGYDGGLVEYVATDDLAEAGVGGFIGPPASSSWSVLGGKGSAADLTRVLLLAASFDSTRATTYAASVPASAIPTLTVGTAPFAAASSIPFQQFPYTTASTSWFGDEFVQVGLNAAGALGLMWISPAGRIVATTSSAGLVRDSNIVATAVQLESNLNEVDGKFDVAWVEHVLNDAGVPVFDRLYAATVTCLATDGG